MGLLDRFLARQNAWDGVQERYSFSDYQALAAMFSFNGNTYIPIQTSYGTQRQEQIGNDFVSYVAHGYKSNGPVFGAILARALLFSEARFKFRNLSDRKVFGGPALLPLEVPGVNMTTGELLFRMEQDVSLAGNWYGLKMGSRIVRLRPDWVSIVVGSPLPEDHEDFGASLEAVGYSYQEGGFGSTHKPRVYLPEQVAHWSPIPDPEFRFRGMSWLQPSVREIRSDNAGSDFKLSFYEHGATPNLAVIMSDEVRTPEQFRQVRDAMEESHAGVAQAFKTLYLAAGADVKVVGADMQKLDYGGIQAAGEARIAVAARVPAAILGIKEGLAGSSLNAGNLAVARRLFADGWARPQWRSACAALAKLIDVPAGAELWYDDSDIAFLREDATDAAQITSIKAQAIRTLTDGGFDPASAVAAVLGGDLSQLTHTGLLSVQMQPPGSGEPGTPAA